MCVACHYQGDNRLVTPDMRAKDHGDDDARCARQLDSGELFCTDCGELLAKQADHLCPRLAAIQIVGPRTPAYRYALAST